MTNKFADRMSRVQPSPTLAASARAKALKAKGLPIINFGPGEPDFDTPQHIKDAAIKALNDGYTKYGPVPGFPELRNAVCDSLAKKHSVNYGPENVIVTCGAKEALYAALQVLVNPGDEVIIPAPYWVSYEDQVKLCDGEAVIINTTSETEYKMTAAQLEKSITPKSKILMINSPSNPTGMLYSKEELTAIAKVCAKHDLWVISDEIYEDLVYAPAKFASFAAAAPELRERTIIINGVSKTYAMTGWRLGWAVGPKDFISEMNTWQGQVVSHATAFAQFGAVAALNGPQDCVEKMRNAFNERRMYMSKALNDIPGLTLIEPQGAFYAFPDISAYVGCERNGVKYNNSIELADYLLEEANIAVVAGEGFGAPGFVRFSYALGLDEIKLGMSRLSEALGALAQ